MRTQRKITKPTDRQERFAVVYASTGDAEEALKEAGYELNTPDAARDAKCRLLRNPTIRARVDELRAKTAAKFGLTAEGVVARLRMVYIEAFETGEWAAAVSALKEIGKLLGLYSEHNAQKKYTRDDLDRIRAELESAGMDFTAVNMPPPSSN